MNIDCQRKSNSVTKSYALFVIMDHKRGFVKRAANFPIERTLCIDAYRINYVCQNMESQGNVAYRWENKIIMILEQKRINLIFVNIAYDYVTEFT